MPPAVQTLTTLRQSARMLALAAVPKTLLKKPATSIDNSQFRMLNAQIQDDFEHWAFCILHWAFETNVFHQPANLTRSSPILADPKKGVLTPD
jgi:hypothetical protein